MTTDRIKTFLKKSRTALLVFILVIVVLSLVACPPDGVEEKTPLSAPTNLTVSQTDEAVSTWNVVENAVSYGFVIMQGIVVKYSTTITPVDGESKVQKFINDLGLVSGEEYTIVVSAKPAQDSEKYEESIATTLKFVYE